MSLLPIFWATLLSMRGMCSGKVSSVLRLMGFPMLEVMANDGVNGETLMTIGYYTIVLTGTISSSGSASIYPRRRGVRCGYPSRLC